VVREPARPEVSPSPTLGKFPRPAPYRLRFRPSNKVVEVFFEIDLILFADREIAGPNADRHLMELRRRKPSAEFVAEQIPRARDEGRDIEPVLSALAEIPCLDAWTCATRSPGTLDLPLR